MKLVSSCNTKLQLVIQMNPLNCIANLPSFFMQLTRLCVYLEVVKHPILTKIVAELCQYVYQFIMSILE